MNDSKFNRRNFLKLAGLSAAAGVMVGCGPASRYVVRRPYPDMPEYNQTGKSTYYATTCRECPAGCGLIVRTFEGRAIKVEGNPNHPVNTGKTCSRAQTAVQGLYNPDRITAPLKRTARGVEETTSITWDDGVAAVRSALQSNAPNEIAFLLGLSSDHLYLLLSELAASLGAPAPVRYGSLGMFDGQATLTAAAQALFGTPSVPYFDFGGADVTFAFGANLLETFLSPVAFSRGYGRMRKAEKRGTLVVFEPRMSLTAANADEWVPLTPGSEGMVALALGQLIAQKRGVTTPAAYSGVSLDSASQFSGISMEKLEHLAELFASSQRPLAIPGGRAAGHLGGVADTQAVLGLNLLAGNLGQPGGVFLSQTPYPPQPAAAAAALVERMRAGQVKALFVHGANPAFELPAAMGFAEALKNVPLVISFSSFPDETALQADYVLPDHTPLESWGFQVNLFGSDRQAVSGSQPVVVPLYQTKATADVFLAAAQNLAYTDEVAFIQSYLTPYITQPGTLNGAEINTFWAQYLQAGGWWQLTPGLEAPTAGAGLDAGLAVDGQLSDPGAYPYYLAVYPTQLGDGSGANRPWLQETPDPMTTVMWNTWVEIHPDTASSLGVTNDDIVRVSSAAGSVEATVYLYPAIRPDTIGIPFGQGHTALGRYAAGRGANAAQLLPVSLNEAGDLAYADVRVKVEPTGKRRLVARYEDKVGVYGEDKK